MPLRVPFTGDEKQSLHVSLDRHRDAVLWKVEGLDDTNLRRVMTPSGTNLLPQKPLRLYPYQFGFVLRVKVPPPLEPDHILKDGDHVGPLQVMHTPGHSRGSLSFWWPERRVLIVGDAVATWPSVMLGWPQINMDERQNRVFAAVEDALPADRDERDIGEDL